MVSSKLAFISVDKDTTSRRVGNIHVHVNSSNSSIEEVLKNSRVDLINVKKNLTHIFQTEVVPVQNKIRNYHRGELSDCCKYAGIKERTFMIPC